MPKLITWTTVAGCDVLYESWSGLFWLRKGGLTRGPFFSWELKLTAEDWERGLLA